MKTLLTAMLTVAISVQLFAQDVTLNFREKSLNHFYIDLISKAATLNGDWGLFGGLRAGYNFNENVSLGLAGHGLIPEKLGSAYINKKDKDELHFGYGGIEAIYKLDISERVYFTGTLLAGAGRVDYESAGGNDYFFITEPGAAFNYRITDWFGLGYSVNYRLASGVNYSDFSNASFSGWSTDFNLKFGF